LERINSVFCRYFNASDEERESNRKKAADGSDEEDELEAFMAGINEQAKKDVSTSKKKEEKAIKTGETSGGRTGRDDIEKLDEEESYFK
jgi:hypothetical protein